MKTIRKLLFIVSILIFSSYAGFAQVFVERMPDAPHYVQTTAPSPRHVWIGDDWETRNGAYVFVGGRWAEPPSAGGKWIPGHWKQKKRGWVWTPGHWR